MAILGWTLHWCSNSSILSSIHPQSRCSESPGVIQEQCLILMWKRYFVSSWFVKLARKYLWNKCIFKENNVVMFVVFVFVNGVVFQCFIVLFFKVCEIKWDHVKFYFCPWPLYLNLPTSLYWSCLWVIYGWVVVLFYLRF